MGHYRLFEWERRRFDAECAVPVAEAESLVRAAEAPAKVLGGPAFEFGRDALTARNLVGVVAAGGSSCEILPKVDRDAREDDAMLRGQLVRMLEVAYDLPVADDAATALDTQSDTLLEVLIARFASLAQDAVRRGLPRAYVAHADDLPALRGRLDATRQFTTLAATPHRLASRYDEFSDDIELNRVMKAAVMRLRRLARSLANRRSLAELALVYADIEDVPPAMLQWHRIVRDRTNNRWQGLLRLAQLILGDQFQNTAHGEADGFALLFDMNKLFERYVAELLAPIAEAAGTELRVQGGLRRCLYPEAGGKALFATETDLRLTQSESTLVVIDTKWKRLADHASKPKMDVDQADIYQVMAYAQVYGCKRTVLLYPGHDGLVSPMPIHHRVGQRDGPVRLTIAKVDVSSHDAARVGLNSLVAQVLT